MIRSNALHVTTVRIYVRLDTIALLSTQIALRSRQWQHDGMDSTVPTPSSAPPIRTGFFDVESEVAVAGNRAYWDTQASQYLAVFGEFLGDVQFRWCPEGLLEADAQILGQIEELREQKVLEVGAGAAQCSRWLASQGVTVEATDIAPGMIREAERINAATGIEFPLHVADARALPYPEDSFNQAFTAFGAIPFIKDATEVHREVARILRPGGRWTFATTHPVKWMFPDDPESLTAIRSYFDRTPYAETSADGTYAEFHRTIGDHISEVLAAGLEITAVIEPEWSEGNDHTWGGWSPKRGAYLPGTLIIQARKP